MFIVLSVGHAHLHLTGIHTFSTQGTAPTIPADAAGGRKKGEEKALAPKSKPTAGAVIWKL
jgi:hypothetical protein